MDEVRIGRDDGRVRPAKFERDESPRVRGTCLQNAPTDARAWTAGDCSQRVVRGGSWYGIPRGLRAAFRYGDPTAGRSYFGGFRVARTN